MREDPRRKNLTFNTSSVEAFAIEYADALGAAVKTVDFAMLEKACALIESVAARGGKIYAIGNGGSAAIADHLCCDWTKGASAPLHPHIQTQSLVANVALYSAIANDYGFHEVFSTQIDFLARQGDALVAISSSGGSPNIVAAVEAAKARGVSTIGLSGFGGGRLRELADIPLHVHANNYGVVEDAHQALMHILAQYIVSLRDLSQPVS